MTDEQTAIWRLMTREQRQRVLFTPWAEGCAVAYRQDGALCCPLAIALNTVQGNPDPTDILRGGYPDLAPFAKQFYGAWDSGQIRTADLLAALHALNDETAVTP